MKGNTRRQVEVSSFRKKKVKTSLKIVQLVRVKPDYQLQQQVIIQVQTQIGNVVVFTHLC